MPGKSTWALIGGLLSSIGRLRIQKVPAALELNSSNTQHADTVYLRIPGGNIQKLLNSHISDDEFARKFFDLDSEVQSVFRVSNEIEEAEAIAAHLLTLNKNSIDERVGIRIKKSDLDLCGITVSAINAVCGDTGHASVDSRHHDIAGSRQSFENLAALLAADCYQGHARIRYVGKYQIYRQLLRFLDENQLSDGKLKKKRRELIDSYKNANPKPGASQDSDW